MRTRLWRQPIVCRAALLILLTCPALAARAADAVDGIAVDQSGSPLPRAFVRVVDGTGRELASGFTDEAGRFHLPASGECRVEASLGGFAAAAAACGPGLRLVLQVAPLQESIVVSATRTETPADQSGVSVTAFRAEDLAARDTPLVADLLRSTPGAMIVRTGAAGGVTSLFVRGGESSYNKVLLDGIPLNEPGGTFNFSNVTTDDLDRVEIVRGAQSALFGSDAMSSVVQLFTRRGERTPRPQVSGSLEAGTYHTVRGGASVAGANGPLDYAIAASRYDTDNREPNSAFGNTSATADVGVRLGADATLRAVARTERGRSGTPGQTAFGRPDLDAFFERHDAAGGVTFDQQLTDRVRQRAGYSVAVSHQESADLVLDAPYTPRFGDRIAPFEFTDFRFDSFSSLRRYHASYQADVRLANGAGSGYQLLTALMDWDGERATLTDRLANSDTPASRDNVGVAVQHQAQWRRIVATAGARLEHNASFGNAAVPRGSFAVVLHDGSDGVGATRVHAAAGLGIKEPTVLQSFSPSPYFRGNPDLLPERSRAVEAGLEQRMLRDRVRLDATWFDNRYENLISTRTTDPTTFSAQYFNIGLTRARGAELSAAVAPSAPLRVRGGYTFLASEIVDSTSPFDPVFQPGQWLFRRPRHSGFLDVAWHGRRAGVNVTGTFIGRFVDSDFASLEPPIGENPGFTTWDARLSYAVTRQLSARLSIDNLADRDYMEPLGYPALRRSIRAGLRVGF